MYMQSAYFFLEHEIHLTLFISFERRFLSDMFLFLAGPMNFQR
jgi:hypothetical protein